MQVKYNLFCLAFSLLALFACDTESNEDSPAPFEGDVYIRFESPSGTNVLDSLGILGEDVSSAGINQDTLSISVSRESDGVALTGNAFWVRVSEHKLTPYFHEEETLVRFSWTDMKTMQSKNRPDDYEEVYRIRLTGPVVFGDNDVHTIDWFVTVSGSRFQDAYRCEVDGREISLEDDPLYIQKSKTNHQVAAIITLACR